jgi:uncharacterized protein YdhG (YjbR/CyaY superfamily)
MPTASKQKLASFSKFEQDAMRNRAKELAAEAKMSKNRAAGEKAVLTAIAELSEPDRGLAEKVHALIKKTAPDLWPKTWYGMPAYAKNDKVVCFFQSAEKFKARYATLGFSDQANLDDGSLWATSYALKKLGTAEAAKIIALIQQAVS